MDNNQNMDFVKIEECEMNFPKIEWDSIVDNLSTVLENNPFKGKKAFSVKDKDELCSNNAQLILNKSNHTHEGIDLPVLLSKECSNHDIPTIMIIGESPIRDTRKLKNRELYIGTPFAVAGKKDVPNQCNIYKYIFCHLLNNGYKVYITDAVKVWYNGLEKKDFIKVFKNNNYHYQEILRKEIESVNPKLIVTWGETALKAINTINDNNGQFPPTFHQIHPVKLNWDRWKVEMLSDAIREGEGVGKDYINDKEKDSVKDPKYLSYYIAQKILKKAEKR